jgi:hypothetical protein
VEGWERRTVDVDLHTVVVVEEPSSRYTQKNEEWDEVGDEDRSETHIKDRFPDRRILYRC